MCVELVPKILSSEQKEFQRSIWVDNLNYTESDSNLEVITCNESWFLTYDPETKHQFGCNRLTLSQHGQKKKQQQQ